MKRDNFNMVDDPTSIMIGRLKQGTTMRFSLGSQTANEGLWGVAAMSIVAAYRESTGLMYALPDPYDPNVVGMWAERRPNAMNTMAWSANPENQQQAVTGYAGYTTFPGEPIADVPTVRFYMYQGQVAVDMHARWKWTDQDYAQITNPQSDGVTRVTRTFSPVLVSPPGCPCPHNN